MPASLPRWLYSPAGEGVIVTTQDDYTYYEGQGWKLRAIDVGFGARGDAERARQGIVQLVPEASQHQVQQLQGSFQEYAEELSVIQDRLNTLETRSSVPEIAQWEGVIHRMGEQVEALLAQVQEQEARLAQVEVFARTVTDAQAETEETPRHERRRH